MRKMKIVRDMNIYKSLNDNFIRPDKIEFDIVPLHKKYKCSYADIHDIAKLIMIGNEYDDSLIIPEYQRDLVWSLEQKQDLILSILHGNPIGEFLFKKDKARSGSEVEIHWTIIDGQQRLNAIKEFIECKFSLPNGQIFDDLKYWDAREFLTGYSIRALSLQDITLKDELDIYYSRNFGGTRHTLEDLQKFLNVKEKELDV